jgi:hypothetical protein
MDLWKTKKMRLKGVVPFWSGRKTSKILSKKPRKSCPKNLENLFQKTAKIVSKKPRKSCPKNRENLFQKTAKIFSKKPRKSCPKKREPSADIDIDVTILVCPEASL